VRRILIAALCFVVAVCVLIEALYVPRFGQSALDAARDDYLDCVRGLPHFFCAPSPCNFGIPSEADCLVAYLDRRETIMWRYFFFRTLATRL
jgi:hypothetical protein